MALTEIQIKNAKEGRHADGNGLYLEVSKSASKSWIFRYQINKNRRDMGLGSLAKVSAVKARKLASDYKLMINEGIDPLDHRKAESVTVANVKKEQEFKLKTFREVALEYMDGKRVTWKNEKHTQQWYNTLETYAYPIFGNIPISEINKDFILKALLPIWNSKNETASRVRNRIEIILDYAEFHELRSGENPARWKGYLEHALHATKKKQRQPALPYAQLSEFIYELRKHNGLSALCLEFAILTAIRSGTARGARWDHIDEVNKVFSPTADIMKNGKEGFHIPLSDEVMLVLEKAKPFRNESGLIFSANKNKPLCDMSLSEITRGMNADRLNNNNPQWIDRESKRCIVPHGFRSTFKDWATELTNHLPDMSEIALAHSVGSKVELAYRRGDMFEKRRAMMDDWGRYCTGTNANIHSINEKTRSVA